MNARVAEEWHLDAAKQLPRQRRENQQRHPAEHRDGDHPTMKPFQRRTRQVETQKELIKRPTQDQREVLLHVGRAAGRVEHVRNVSDAKRSQHRTLVLRTLYKVLSQTTSAAWRGAA